MRPFMRIILHDNFRGRQPRVRRVGVAVVPSTPRTHDLRYERGDPGRAVQDADDRDEGTRLNAGGGESDAGTYW